MGSVGQTIFKNSRDFSFFLKSCGLGSFLWASNKKLLVLVGSYGGVGLWGPVLTPPPYKNHKYMVGSCLGKMGLMPFDMSFSTSHLQLHRRYMCLFGQHESMWRHVSFYYFVHKLHSGEICCLRILFFVW